MVTATLPPLLRQSTGLVGLAFRSDGRRLATADTALNLEILDGDRSVWTRTLASVDPKVASVGRIRRLAYSPDGALLYALGNDELIAFESETGETRWRYAPKRSFGFLVVSPVALAVRDDGLIAASFDNGAIGIWSPEGEMRGFWRDLDVQRNLAFLRDGNLLGDDSFGLSVFDVDTRKRLYRTPLRDRSFGLAVAPDGNVAVRTLHEVWQIAPTGEVFARSPVEPGLPLLAYHPFAPILALGAARSVSFVNPDGATVRRVEVTGTTTVSMAFSPDGRLAIGGADRTRRTFDLEEVDVG